MKGKKEEYVIDHSLIHQLGLAVTLQKHGKIVAYNMFDPENSPKATEPLASITIEKNEYKNEFSTLALAAAPGGNQVDLVIVEEHDIKRLYVHWISLKRRESGGWKFKVRDRLRWKDKRYGTLFRALTFVRLDDEPQRKVLAGCEFERKKYLRLFELAEETGRIQKLDIEGEDEDDMEVYHKGDWPYTFVQAEGSKRHYSVDELGWLNILTVGNSVA